MKELPSREPSFLSSLGGVGSGSLIAPASHNRRMIEVCSLADHSRLGPRESLWDLGLYLRSGKQTQTIFQNQLAPPSSCTLMLRSGLDAVERQKVLWKNGMAPK